MFHSDNLSVVSVSAKMSAPNVVIMDVIRRIFFVAAQNNFTLRLTHISGTDNSLADALSRFDNSRFFALHPSAERVCVPADHTLEFLHEAVLQPGNCSSSMQDVENSFAVDWRLLPEEVMEMGSNDFTTFV